jgi:RNA polymerase sigma-70 factor (ECF subfamily)
MGTEASVPIYRRKPDFDTVSLIEYSALSLIGKVSKMDAESLSSFDRTSSVDAIEGFERLYRQHAPAVLRYAVRCVGRMDIAEEITSDAFLALYRNLRNVDAARLPAWLFTVVRNSATSYWRRTLVERKHLDKVQESASFEDGSLWMSILQMPELKPVHRACLILRYAHDMDRAEIASTLGLTDNQVKSYLQYGLDLVRKNLLREGAI